MKDRCASAARRLGDEFGTRWPIGLRASLMVGIPLLADVAVGRTSWGAVASMGAFAGFYGPVRPTGTADGWWRGSARPRRCWYRWGACAQRGCLHHIGIGREHARIPILMLVQDLRARVINAAIGELIRELTTDPARDYQPTAGPKPKRPRTR